MAIRKAGRKPRSKRTTMRNIAMWGNRTLKPEREERYYEFANGTKTKKAGLGAYSR